MEYYLHHWIEQFGYIGIMIALMGGIVGLPIPDEVLLTYVGYNVFTGAMSFPLTLVCSFIGAIIGISISYCLGIKLGLPFLHKFGPKVHITEARIEQTKVLFAKMGPFVLVIGYFIPGIRHISAFLAGINEYKFKKFAIYAYSGALLWVLIFITLGKELGKDWKNVKHYMEHYSTHLLPLLIIALLIGACVSYWRLGTSAKNDA
ncbi:DedA family protein [Thermaerobacillus caldiproteolyticus]|uniref:Membrane protein DedA with SNARE-associated domain n=1 Tax=Thermaerobacillus caldiproteolyticus TaxID=247480 RepID=A0A7V9Z637_9BACL|nr:DedA family protein [Anoxybacillus caldiproteolyticus]MBA2874730.1 membrane protein DedA with SNARE-associated domain [Anoxybacillus caldiproteolyticus]